MNRITEKNNVSKMMSGNEVEKRVCKVQGAKMTQWDKMTTCNIRISMHRMATLVHVSLKPSSHLRFECNSVATLPRFEPIRSGDWSPPRIAAESRVCQPGLKIPKKRRNMKSHLVWFDVL